MTISVPDLMPANLIDYTFPELMLTSLCVNELWPVPFVSAFPSLAWLCLLPTDASCAHFPALFLCL